ncbi:MAG TPA: hypothetical protein VG452_00380 [Egibacteraceae bacterium]|nr:hypothetical protein [Egibacteraceae bacterium]
MTSRGRRCRHLFCSLLLLAAACGEQQAQRAGSGPAQAQTSPAGKTEAACQPAGDPQKADTVVEVTLREWAIEPEPVRAPAGRIAFIAHNRGGEAHELLLVRGGDPAALPLDEAGAVDEEALGPGTVVGEIEEFPGGVTCEGAFALEAGDYVLVCNVVETEPDGSTESHYAMGMATTFTVTD